MHEPSCQSLIGCSCPPVFRLPPDLGEPHLDEAAQRSHARSRLARWRQVRLARREFISALVYDTRLFLRPLCPLGRVATLWTRSRGGHRGAVLVRDVTQMMDKWLRATSEILSQAGDPELGDATAAP